MPKDVPRVPNFGAFIKRRRSERSLQSLTTQMNAIGVSRVNSALFRYEAGRVPPVDVLRGLSFALKVPFEELVDMVLKELGIAQVQWGRPVVHIESDLPDDALAIARAYAACDEDHVKSATRSLLRVDHPTGSPEVSRPRRFLRRHRKSRSA